MCPNGKVYIGQCVSILSNGTIYGTHGRWINHLSDARRYNGGNCRRLNEAIRVYGAQSFKVEKLLQTHVSLLDMYEEATISLLDSTNPEHGYNLRYGGNHSRLSEITKEIMSINRRNKPCFAQPHTQETKQKISQTLISNVVRTSHTGSILPKYVKFIDWKDRKGYAVVSHPKCKLKYFVSKATDLDTQLNSCIQFIQSLDCQNHT